MTKTRTALIVGGGIAGMSAAIALRKAEVEVDLIDKDPLWRVYGAGITITGPTLRAFKALGVLDEVMAQAYTGNGIRVCAVDGSRVDELATPMPADAGVPGSGGIMRPVLHKILSSAVIAAGTDIRLGLTVDAITAEPDAANVTFSDHTTRRYDLVLGADGLSSRVRTLLFPHAPPPKYTGQSVWRLTVNRDPQIDKRHYFLGGPVKVGLSPVSADSMYMFLVENRPTKDWVAEADLHHELRRLLAGYGGILSAIRYSLSAESQIVFRPLEAFLMPQPWHIGRVLLLGDAVHPTTPQLASGAGMAVEDALVLAEELKRGGSIDQAYASFMHRRYRRCLLVVENSLEIGRREMAGASPASQTEIVQLSLRALAEPI